MGAVVMPDRIDFSRLHDEALADWYAGTAAEPPEAADIAGLVRAQHFCNFTLWGLEDEARRRDVDDTVIAGIKRSIDARNQNRNDLIERIDEAVLAVLPPADPGHGEQHSETAGQMIDRLSILSLKIWHMGVNARRTDDRSLAAQCAAKLEVLKAQRLDLAACLRRLLEDCRKGRRFFKLYRQFKQYNDPLLNPALRRARGSA
jgi:hypothetical protein